MTRYSSEQIERMRKDVAGKVVRDLEYEQEDDYFVMTFTDNSETAFRFMADLIVYNNNS